MSGTSTLARITLIIGHFGSFVVHLQDDILIHDKKIVFFKNV